LATVKRHLPPLPLLVFVVGMAALGIEIAAVRLLAPYFGASEVVWANTIGVVLIALAAGYHVGGKFADRYPRMDVLCTVVLSAAVLTALLPIVARPLLNAGVEALDAISAGAFVGSLLATLVLLAVPVFMLGTVSPWALRIGIEHVDKLEAGALAGRLYALGTAGSLVGTLSAALVLIPGLGTRRTFFLFALLLALTALPGVRRHRAGAVLATTAIAALMLLPAAGIKQRAQNGTVIHEDETRTQYVRVIERADGTRSLELNEGQSRHSVLRPDSVLIDDYWDTPLVLPLATGNGPPEKIAILGNAAGTTARSFGHFFPDTHVTGVELDGELEKIGRRWFAMDEANITNVTADARPFLRSTDARFDMIMLDAYRQPYIPFYLTTVEFFELVATRLNPGGSVIVNVGHPKGSDRLVETLAAALGESFEHVWASPTRPTNTQLLASDSAIDPELMLSALADVPELKPTGQREAALMRPAPTTGEAFTDDRAPVEWLIDRSIVEYATGG
jgi:spermidine synthase